MLVMKHLLLFCLFLIPGWVVVQAQNDSTVYIHGLPVSGDDTVQHFPKNDLPPNNNIVIIPENQLPSSLLKALNKDKRYSGWKAFPVYYNTSTEVYNVTVKNAADTTYYGFNSNGKPVTYGRNTIDDQ
jgi:hypothetical protein